MFRRTLVAAAVAALAAGVSAYAANPFSDVSTSDWAYQAVSQLSDQGIVEGYPDGTFRGQRNITRYELAQIIARLMANEDQFNAEQRATIDKLAGEYADELDNLGVRVSNLENKVGNISWSGDARVRYIDFGGNKGDQWDGRMRIQADAQVNDNTRVVGRLRTDMDFRNDDSTDSTYMDALYVDHQFGRAVDVQAGRVGVVFGDQAGWLFGDAKGMDGVKARVNFDQDSYVNVGFGRFNASSSGVKDHDAFFAQGRTNIGTSTLGVDYIRFTGDENEAGTLNTGWHAGDDNAELLGASLNVPFNNFRVFGEYWKNTTTPSDYDTAWNAGLGYGHVNPKAPGTWQLDVAYNDVDRDVYFGGTGLTTGTLLAFSKDGATNVRFWNAMADVALEKNVVLHGEYAFAAKADNAADPSDSYSVTFNFLF
ncbi:MAG: S-layer protein [Veillonellaceae bacterium]|nr:MAG: S-layer protein [Veillonellaceae bacterium]